LTITEDAIRAGNDCVRAIDEYNVHRKEDGYDPIKVGFGANSGQVLLGTIGDKNRMEGTGKACLVPNIINLLSCWIKY
jgi:class 3 adenylate cyclase